MRNLYVGFSRWLGNSFWCFYEKVAGYSYKNLLRTRYNTQKTRRIIAFSVASGILSRIKDDIKLSRTIRGIKNEESHGICETETLAKNVHAQWLEESHYAHTIFILAVVV